MITKNELKYYSNLLKKKFRDKEKKFITEGEKIVLEGLDSNFVCEKIFVTHEYLKKDLDFLNSIKVQKILEILKKQDFLKLSDTVHSQEIAAVFQIPDNINETDLFSSKLIVCLDNISDPGNVGTILRNCDWFGINWIMLTKGCADIFNPKTLRASMGSIFHLKIFNETDPNFLNDLKKKNYKILIADIKGKNLFDYKFPEKGVIVFSNESAGPGADLIQISDDKITIPKFGKAESLNVASASAVILSMIKNSELLMK
jgi:TrmH family RNA methyltransferase